MTWASGSCERSKWQERHDGPRAGSETPGRRGANFVGSAAEIAEKILYQDELFGHDRFLSQFTVGALPHARVMRSIELFGTAVAPVVRKAPAPSEKRVSAAPGQ